MNKYIDRTPPAQTGNAETDQKAIFDYLVYLREQMNWILNLIYKEGDK